MVFLTNTNVNILIVDDEPDLRSVISLMLEANFPVKTLPASSKAQAFEVLESHKSTLVGVICDFQIRDGTGQEVLNHLKSIDPKIPLIFCSGAPLESNSNDPMIVAFLLKPFTKAEILDAVEKGFKITRKPK